MKQRLAVALTLSTSPSLIILDEPTLGMDVEATEDLKGAMRRLAAEGRCVLITTHQMDVAQALCDRIAIMADGRLAVVDTPDNLISLFSLQAYDVVVKGALPEPVAEQLADMGQADIDCAAERTILHISADAPNAVYRVLSILADAQLELLAVKRCEPNLAQVYLSIVREGEARSATLDCAPSRI